MAMLVLESERCRRMMFWVCAQCRRPLWAAQWRRRDDHPGIHVPGISPSALQPPREVPRCNKLVTRSAGHGVPNCGRINPRIHERHRCGNAEWTGMRGCEKGGGLSIQRYSGALVVALERNDMNRARRRRYTAERGGHWQGGSVRRRDEGGHGPCPISRRRARHHRCGPRERQGHLLSGVCICRKQTKSKGD